MHQILDDAEEQMESADAMHLPHRIVHLPLAFNEKWTHDAINRCAEFSAVSTMLDWNASKQHVVPIICLPLFLLYRYMRSVRSEAPYLPSNVKFIAGGVLLVQRCRRQNCRASCCFVAGLAGSSPRSFRH